MRGFEDSGELLMVEIVHAVVGLLPFFVAFDVEVINLLGLLRPFTIAFCVSSLASLVAVVLLTVLDWSTESLDDTLELLDGGTS